MTFRHDPDSNVNVRVKNAQLRKYIKARLGFLSVRFDISAAVNLICHFLRAIVEYYASIRIKLYFHHTGKTLLYF